MTGRYRVPLSPPTRGSLGAAAATPVLRIGRVPTLLVVLFAVMGASAVHAASAQAYCQGAGCNNQNPRTTGCDQDARPLESFYYGNFFVELRYSPRCYAAWTRISGGNPQQGCIGGWTRTNFGVLQGSPGGKQDMVCARDGYTFYTRMLDYHLWVRACYGWIGTFDEGDGLRIVACTRWR